MWMYSYKLKKRDMKAIIDMNDDTCVCHGFLSETFLLIMTKKNEIFSDQIYIFISLNR